jgi:uncharacterized membrane protein YcfT
VLQILFKVGLGTGDVGTGRDGQIALGRVEPYGVLWFIYMLALYSLAAKLLHELRVPHWAALVPSARGCMIVPIHTGFGR